MNSMTSRQRILTALDGDVPDRLPASMHGWMTYWLEKYGGGISSEEAYDKFGLDWSTYLWPWKPDESDLSNWKYKQDVTKLDNGNQVEEISITTPEKKLTQLREIDKYHSPWTTGFLFKDPEDVFIFCKFHPAEFCNEEVIEQALTSTGDKGIVRGCRIGPWHRLCEFYGVEKMIYATFEDPKWVHDAMRGMTDLDMRAFESMKGSKLDLMETGGGHNSSTVVSPDLFRTFILPYEKELHHYLTGDLGVRTVYHVCGGMMPILDDLVEIGSTALETLTPPEMGGDVDLAELKRRVGDKVSLIGGFDQFNGFENGTVEDTRRLVRYCFETAGANGGYIMNPSDHFYDGPVERIAAYADEAKKCVYS